MPASRRISAHGFSGINKFHGRMMSDRDERWAGPARMRFALSTGLKVGTYLIEYGADSNPPGVVSLKFVKE
jgi:hypothetical protein